VREQDRGGRTWYTMLATVREYGRETLEERGVLGEMQERHARFYAALADTTAKRPSWSDQVEQMTRLADERDELRGAVDHFLATHQYAAVAQLTWNLYWFWWVGGQLGEVRRWMARLLAPGLDLDDRSKIIALFCTNSVRFGETPDAAVVSALAECVAYFHADGDRLGEGLSLVTLAIAQMSESPPDLDAAERSLAQSLELVEESGDPFGRTMVRVMSARAAMARGRMAEAFALLDDGLAIARGVDDRLGEAIALSHLGWARLMIDDPDGARASFTEQLRISSTFGHEEGFAYGLEGLSAVAAATGDIERAGLLFGAAETVRLRKGLTTGGVFSIHGRILERALANGGTETFEAGRRAGRSADLADMVELALAGTTSTDV
jgi:ATP/maltotriose-dependent transcriptional regulator MalT